MTINVYASSFQHLKSTIFFAPRRCLILAFARNFVSSFQQLSSNPHSIKFHHYFLQSISSNHAYQIFYIRICNGVVVVMSNLSLGLDSSSISMTCHLILDIFNSSFMVFKKLGKFAGSLGFSIDSLLYFRGENSNDVKSYVSSKFKGGRGRFKLNAFDCFVDSHASIIIVGGMFDSHEATSRVVLSWHACSSCRTLIVAISTWISFVSSHPEVMLMVAQWSSPSCRELMFLSGSSVLS
jgi:hypothetical protein